jgi:hypothetical protein
LTSTEGASRVRGRAVGPRPSRPRGRALALALAVLALISAGVARPARAAVDPIGAHSMLQLNDPPSFMEAMFAQAAAMHASAIRLDVAPALIFTSPSEPPDFSGLDRVVALAQTHHLQVVADLLTIPAWMADCAAPTSNPSRCATDDLSDYTSIIGQIVTRAEPVIRDWEVWNEPDTPQFFDGTPQQYALMLRAAHDAIKSVDAENDVLLGGISSVAATSWLAQVFATPGADAIHAFDVANLHERGDLWQLHADEAGFRAFLARQGFGGPLWITEHGYPSDPGYQYDPGYTGGAAAQAAFLQASVPTLIDAGAARVFVTERDNLSGAFASEGVLGGDVADPPPADPQIVAKPAFAVVQHIADCYALLGRDCPDAPAVASPSAAFLPPVAPGGASRAWVTLTDPGSVPVALGEATIGGPSPAGLAVAANTCTGMVLEPRETCSVSVQFTPATPGDVTGDLQLATDDGPLSVALSASAPSLSGLVSADLSHPRFLPTGGGNGVGYPQRWRLALTNPFGAKVSIARAVLSGADAPRFRITSDRCARVTLRPHGGCRLTVTFAPTRPGTAHGQLTLQGTGSPLVIQLRPVAFALPAVTRLTAGARRGCAIGPGAAVTVTVSQAARVRWMLTRAGPPGRRGCPRTAAPPGPVVASGATGTARRRGGYAARWSLPGATRVAPGGYVLTVLASNAHGTGASRAMAVRLRP